MRILYVINSVEGGGAALPVPAVVRVLEENGASVEILALTRRDGRALGAMREAGLSVRVRDGGERDHFAAFSWLDRQVELSRPDLIWTSLTRATLLGQQVGRRRGAPVVSWQHNAFLKPANRILLRATQGLTGLWVCDSESVAALTAQRLGVEPDRLAIWPLFAADPDAPRAQPWRRGERLQLGSLGRLHPAKGYDVLIAALAHMRAAGFRPPVPFSIAIAGDGHARAQLEAALRNARIENLQLQGFNGQPRAFLADLHLYLQPSRAEGLCIAAHEAMQAGLPTIVSSVGQLAHSVEDRKTGLIVAPADPRALANALMMLLARPDGLAPMGAAARQRVLLRFGAQAFAAAGGEVFGRLTGGILPAPTAPS